VKLPYFCSSWPVAFVGWNELAAAGGDGSSILELDLAAGGLDPGDQFTLRDEVCFHELLDVAQGRTDARDVAKVKAIESVQSPTALLNPIN
jgi:hypothetical protein